MTKVPRSERGFTLIELLVVIAIIGILIGLLLAGQAIRMVNNTENAKAGLGALVQCANEFRRAVGRSPIDLVELFDWRQQIPCGPLKDVREDGVIVTFGYSFSVLASAPNNFLVAAEPIIPGISGSVTLTADHKNPIRESPTPGARRAGWRLSNEILTAGADAAGALLKMHPEATGRAPAFVSDPATIRQVLEGLDENDDGVITLPEILEHPPDPILVSDQGLLAVYNSFRQSVAHAMKWGAGSEGTGQPPGVALEEVAGDPAALFGFSTLGRLCRALVRDDEQGGPTREDIVDSLIAKIDAAEAAADRGDLAAKQRAIQRFLAELQRLAGTHLTYNAAATLTALARTL